MLMFLKFIRKSGLFGKEGDFCTPFQTNVSVLTFNKPKLVLLLCLILPLACQHKPTLQEEYKVIQESASKLRNGKVFIVDSDSSYVEWKLKKEGSPDLTGRFKPSKGTLILENEQIVAGFFEGDLWDGNSFLTKTAFNLAKEKTALLDSFPKLNGEWGRIVRMDITQTGHNIARSDYHSISSFDTTSNLVLLSNLTLADSLLPVTLPVKETLSTKRIELKGNFRLNARDFGVLIRPRNPNYKTPWSSEIPLSFHLVFRPLK
jgi:hypothetical protein